MVIKLDRRNEWWELADQGERGSGRGSAWRWGCPKGEEEALRGKIYVDGGIKGGSGGGGGAVGAFLHEADSG